MKITLRRILIVISVLAAAAGGVIFDDHKTLGLTLIFIGVIGSVYLFLDSEANQAKSDRFADTTARILALSGAGNPYTQMIEEDLAKPGKYRNILEALDKALEIDPNDVNALAQYVTISALHLSFANQVAPGSVTELNALFAKTAERIDRGLKIGHERFQFCAAKGILLDEIGKHAEARQWFDEVGKVQSFPFPFWRLLKATSFGQERDYVSALQELEKALEEGARGPTFDFYYARALASVGEYDTAIARLNRVRTARGNYYHLLDQLRLCHHFAWHPISTSYFALLSAIYLFPKSRKRSLAHMRDALLALGVPILMKLFDIIEGVARRTPFLRSSKLTKLQDPGNPYVSLGMSLIQSGNYGAAQMQFLRAAKTSNRFNTWMNLCSSSIMLGDWDEAGRAYQYLAKHWPEEIPAGYGEAISQQTSCSGRVHIDRIDTKTRVASTAPEAR
jgi:tetratricopeptide (TPR) repeat protein